MQLEDGWIKDLICLFFFFFNSLKLSVSGQLREVSNQGLEIKYSGRTAFEELSSRLDLWRQIIIGTV